MTSLLAFVWRKTDENCPPTDIDDHDFSPAVSASSSGETLTNQANEDSILDSPPTPEGFRPRKSVETIRRELNLPCNLSQRWLPACSALPPVLSCGSMPSPQASTSSFYSRSSKHQVAVSPNLGQAKTAVGALVAIAGVRAPVDKSSTDPKRESSILPPRTWLNDSRNIQDGNGYNAELPYESLNDSYTSPSKSHEHQFSGASDDESSIHASPSSTNWRSTLAAQKRQHNTSFTQGFLKMDPNVSTDHYDFYPLDGQDFVITDASAPALNMSGISHYTKDLESLHSLVDDADDDIEEDGCFEAMDAEDQSFCESLHRNKLMNQYRMKEDLLLSTLERLQDEPDLLFEVFGALKQQNGFQNGSFRMEKESFLTGYSREKREMICRSIDSIVNELRTSPQEEFFLSPSQLPEFTGTHDELEQALLFCRSLVRNAIPAAEKPVKLQL